VDETLDPRSRRSWTFRTDATGRSRVALGTSVIWEVQKAHHIDSVRVDLVTV
jgi:hypothetical protein